MSTAPARTPNRKTMALAITASALALAALIAASPAKADGGKHRGWDNGRHGHHHLPPGQAKKHGHHHGYAPVHVYAPPPVVYVPRPVYYHPPQPGITVVIPLTFD